jgi:hypothetical protein
MVKGNMGKLKVGEVYSYLERNFVWKHVYFWGVKALQQLLIQQ